MSQLSKSNTVVFLSDTKSKTLNFFSSYGFILSCLLIPTGLADEKSEPTTKPVSALEGNFANSSYKKLTQGAKLSATEKSVLISLESFKKDVATNPDNAKSLLKNFLTDLTGSKGKASKAATIFKKNPELLLAILIEVDAAAPEAAKSITDTRSYKRSSVFNEISRLNGTLKKAKQQGNVFTSKNLKSLLTNKDIEKALTVACDVNSKDRGYAALGIGRVSSFFGSTENLVRDSVTGRVSKNSGDVKMTTSTDLEGQTRIGGVIKQANLPVINQFNSGYCGVTSVMNAAQQAFSLNFPKEKHLLFAGRLASLRNKDAGNYSNGSSYPSLIASYLGLDSELIKITGDSPSEVKEKTKDFLVTRLVPHLKKGGLANILINKPGRSNHAVHISAFDGHRKEFFVHDSAGGNSNWRSLYWLSTNMYLPEAKSAESTLIEANSKKIGFRAPLDKVELIINNSVINQCKELNNLKELLFYDINNINEHREFLVSNIAVKWRKNARVTDKTGLSLACNINNMDGRVVYAAFAKSSTKFEFVIVNGYRGGFGAEEGDVKITYLNGKSQWMDNKDFNKKLAFNFRKKEKPAGYHNVFKGRQGVFLAFPKKPIRCEVLDTKLEPSP